MKSSEVLKLLKVSRVTLSKYVKEGKIKVLKLHNGYYDYDKFDVFNLAGIDNRKNVIYCRVSTNKQKNDLSNQINFIKTYCNNKNIIIDHIFTDIESGMIIDRPDFNKLLSEILEYKIDKIFISNRDRLTRTGYKTLQDICNKFFVDIIICENETIDPDKELLNEIISLIHCFSMKTYSARRKKRLEIIEETLKLDNEVEK